MKKLFFFMAAVIVAAALSLPAFSQSSERETRDVKGFSEVSFGIAGNLNISFGREYKVVLEGDADILREIKTELSSGKLLIKKDNHWFNYDNKKVIVNITMPSLEGLTVSGSGRAEVKDAVKGEDLELSVSGSGTIYVGEVNVQNLECNISGSGNIVSESGGHVADAEISISGSGNYRAERLEAETLEVGISGSGNCSCSVSRSLEAHVSGSGNVNYYGNPRVDAHVSGSGKVRSK